MPRSPNVVPAGEAFEHFCIPTETGLIKDPQTSFIILYFFKVALKSKKIFLIFVDYFFAIPNAPLLSQQEVL